jgi:two-component system, NarL family, nitrate/nitrite response regulator NarL
MTNSVALTQRLLIVDDHPLFRKGVSYLISQIPAFEVVGEASSGREGIDMALTLRPDLILLDLNMKDMKGTEVLKQVKMRDADVRIVILTVSDDVEDLSEALRAGADGYLLKDTEPEELLLQLKDAAIGKITLTESLVALLAHSMRQQSPPKTIADAHLTEQELRVLELIAVGKSNKLIARELDIAEGTVKVHVKHLLKKLHSRSRVEAAVWYVTVFSG